MLSVVAGEDLQSVPGFFWPTVWHDYKSAPSLLRTHISNLAVPCLLIAPSINKKVPYSAGCSLTPGIFIFIETYPEGMGTILKIVVKCYKPWKMQ